MKNTDNNTAPIHLTSVRDDVRRDTDDVVAVEEPLEIRLGYTDPHKGRLHKSVSITMRTPGDDTNLACGFLYSESIVESIADIVSIDASADNVIRIELREDKLFDLARLERHFYTTSSCGVCGKASLESLSTSGYDALRDNDFTLEDKTLRSLPDRLRKAQALFERTGGCHGTATFSRQGEIIGLTEDVGRHNAIDKLIGGMLRAHLLPMQEMGIIVSGRASFELMQKALTAGCPMLVAVGAPSSLAVELAEEFNITLVGFLNKNGYNIYHNPAAVTDSP